MLELIVIILVAVLGYNIGYRQAEKELLETVLERLENERD